MRLTRSFTLVIVAIVAGFGGMLLARTFFSVPEPVTLRAGTALLPSRPLPPLRFVDHTGRPFTAEQLANRWTFIFFGFTHCPDVCPTTLAMLSALEKGMSDLPEQQRPQVVLLSVDPERDTAAQLAAYVHFFNPRFVGISATPEVTEDFTRKLGVPVAKRDLGNGGYTVDHSSALFLVGPEGHLRALFTPPHDPAAIAADYRQLVLAPPSPAANRS